ncbi:hypothetical protein HU750_08950 [Pseudomonas sp. SWRI50]|uniref:hypothetical protein n=1 Tax=Pseudomonas sp. SWRI50 TaxID=2745484 RepID=UPI0016474357|nr:hypothetical protein [Pseudomonas sp. SWRI50]MBC3485798.1 hypothetical protein [Pseudomonas sp. SWRI50]
MDINTWPIAVKLSFVIMPFVISMSGFAMSAYIALTRHYQVVCSSVTSNSYIECLKVTWGGSCFKWRLMLVCAIGGLVTFPWFVLRRGQVDAEELKKFPPKLKRWLAVSTWLAIIGFAWMVFAGLVIKISKV